MASTFIIHDARFKKEKTVIMMMMVKEKKQRMSESGILWICLISVHKQSKAKTSDTEKYLLALQVLLFHALHF